MTRAWRIALVVLAVGALARPGRLWGQTFNDPDRLKKLQAAFPDIDRLFRDFATRTHVPGIAYGIVVDGQLARTDEEMSQMLRGGIPFSNPPGLAYEYSNYGFAILGRIVANVSGVKYREYVAANILSPLGLSATTLDAGAVRPDRFAHGY